MRRAAAILAGLVVLAVPVPLQAQDSPFQYAACPMELPEDVVEGETLDCGYLTVPADHLDDDGTTIELAVAIIYSWSDEPEPDPVLYLEGGPGGEALSAVDFWVGSPTLETRDLIIFDQRGTGYSAPYLDCVEPDGELEEALESLAVCREELEAEGIDLDDYDSLQSAADVETLRLVLGYDEWNLFGISYGTRLALTVMRALPDGIRSVVLDGVYPPQVNTAEVVTCDETAALENLFDACAADRTCDAVYPFLDWDFWNTVDSLQEEPLLVPYVDEAGEDVEESVDGAYFYETIKESLNDWRLIPWLPAVIDATAYGEPGLLADLFGGALPPDGGYARLRQAVWEPDGDATGMYWSVECSEEVPFNDPEVALADATTARESIRDYMVEGALSPFAHCELWGATPSSGVEVLAVESDIPALILNGQFDVATPAKWGRLAAETLPNSWVYEIPGAGHSTTDVGTCPNDVMTSFLDNPWSEPASACVWEMGPPDWVVTGLYWRD